MELLKIRDVCFLLSAITYQETNHSIQSPRRLHGTGGIEYIEERLQRAKKSTKNYCEIKPVKNKSLRGYYTPYNMVRLLERIRHDLHCQSNSQLAQSGINDHILDICQGVILNVCLNGEHLRPIKL